MNPQDSRMTINTVLAKRLKRPTAFSTQSQLLPTNIHSRASTHSRHRGFPIAGSNFCGQATENQNPEAIEDRKLS
jgi:hypothetical protein